MSRVESRRRRRSLGAGRQPSRVAHQNPDNIGGIPPNLLPDRSSRTQRTPAAESWRSPMKGNETASRLQAKYSARASRSPSPLHRGTMNQNRIINAQGKTCPYGWHASPERPVEVVEIPTRDAAQDQEMNLIKKQLQIALEQVRGLREENQSLKITSPRTAAPAAMLTPPAVFKEEGELLSFVSKIDSVIKHHEKFASEAAAPATDADIMSPARPSNFAQLRLEQAEQTIESQKQRISELESRLAQREIHIDTLTRSLIDLGQHNSKLQSQVVSIVNEPPRSEVPVELPPSNALEEIQSKQALIKMLDEKVEKGVENIKKIQEAATPTGGGNPDYSGIMNAIEEHKTRADQIISLNKQSMSMLKTYYLDKGEGDKIESAPAPAAPEPVPVRSISCGESPAAQVLLATGRWIRDYDKSLGKPFYYSPSENRITWDIELEVLKEEAAAAISSRAPSPAPPSSTRMTSLATLSPAVPPRPTPHLSAAIDSTSLA